jgi:tetratricopeptide (TPR) repeat protein
MQGSMILFLCLLFLQQNAAPPVDVNSVAALIRARSYSEALQQTGELLRQAPRSAQLWTLQGLAHSGINETEAALNDYKHALQISPDYIPALKAEAQIEYEKGSPSGVATLRHILTLEPADPVSHAMLGALAYRQHDCKTTIASYSEAGDLLASQPTALTQYGECLFQEKQDAQAIRAFRQAATLEPDAWQFRYNLGLAEFAANHTREALQELQPLLTPQQHRPEVLSFASTLYEAVGDTPRAVSLLRQAIVDNPSDTKLYLQFADLSFGHKSFQVGVDVLNAGLTQLPHSAELYVARGVLLIQLGKYEPAEADFAKAEQLNPNQGFSSVAQGLAKLQENKLDQALSTTEAQIKHNPNNAFLYYLKAETLRQKGASPPSLEFQEAVQAARTAVRLRPNYPIAEDLLGSFYLKENKIDLARRQFESALRQDPANESALYHMITVSRKQGRTADVSQFAKGLAEAKAAAKKRDDVAGQFVLVEPEKP